MVALGRCAPAFGGNRLSFCEEAYGDDLGVLEVETAACIGAPSLGAVLANCVLVTLWRRTVRPWVLGAGGRDGGLHWGPCSPWGWTCGLRVPWLPGAGGRDGGLHWGPMIYLGLDLRTA